MPFSQSKINGRFAAKPVLPRLLAQSEYVTECGCLIWTGRLDKSGYGQLGAGGKYQCTSRLSWIEHKGPIPAGLCVLHRCDIRSCINPDHLFLGTVRDNFNDMVRKGRANFRGRLGKRKAS